MRDNSGPRAVLNALERLAAGYEHDCRHLKAEIGVKQEQLKDFESRLVKPFAHGVYKDELEGLRDQFKLGLSEHPPEGATPTSELAEQIQALRASVTVEAAPERTGTRRAVRAERPVTQRIRERMGEQPVPVAAETQPETVATPVEAKPEPVEKPEEPPASPPASVITMPQNVKPDYRQTVTRRRGDGRQLSLFEGIRR